MSNTSAEDRRLRMAALASCSVLSKAPTYNVLTVTVCMCVPAYFCKPAPRKVWPVVVEQHCVVPPTGPHVWAQCGLGWAETGRLRGTPSLSSAGVDPCGISRRAPFPDPVPVNPNTDAIGHRGFGLIRGVRCVCFAIDLRPSPGAPSRAGSRRVAACRTCRAGGPPCSSLVSGNSGLSLHTLWLVPSGNET